LIADVETLARIHRLDKVGPNGAIAAAYRGKSDPAAQFLAIGSQPFSVPGFSRGFRIPVRRTTQDWLNIGISAHPPAASML
jgi:hypothetical protein